MTRVEIRPFEDGDYRLLVEIDRFYQPEEPLSEDAWRHLDATKPPGRMNERQVVEIDGIPAATGRYGQADWLSDPGSFVFRTMVHPDREHPGVRPAHLAHVVRALEPHGLRRLVTTTIEHVAADVGFLESQGFEIVQREPRSVLDVRSFDWARFGPVAERVRADGIMLRSLTDIGIDGDAAQRALHDVHEEVMADVPSPEPYPGESFEDFATSRLGGPLYDPDLWLVAEDDGRLVGTSRLIPLSGAPDRMVWGLTGVVRSHRRRGVATAMKTELIRAAASRGVTSVATSNAETNPMFALNLELGFRPLPAIVVYARDLPGNDPDAGNG